MVLETFHSTFQVFAQYLRWKTPIWRPDWFRDEKRSLLPSEAPRAGNDADVDAEISHSPSTPLHLRIRTITGWDRSSAILLSDCIVATGWGIALLIFSLGLVPFTYGISEWGKDHLAIINFFVTVVASLTTAHVKRLLGSLVSQLANYRILSGFTLRQLEWMQGVREWDSTAPFPRRIKPIWVLLWGGMALHTASVVSIMTPVKFVDNVPFKDTAPCGVQPEELTLGPITSLSSSNETTLDQSAFVIGLQLGTYYQAVRWNSTTTVFSRPYVKENVSYGSIGGLHDGLLNVSGVLFDVQCATEKDGQDALNSVWARTFPNRSFPLVQITPDKLNTSISGSFSDPPINTSSMQSVTSSTTFNLTTPEMALYSLVNANGDGGLLGIAVAGTVVCSWKAIPKLVDVILVNWVAKSNGIRNATTVPQYVGRGVLATVKGMAQAVLTGSQLDKDRVDGDLYNSGTPPTPHMPSTSEMLAVLLADGVRSTLTGFAIMSRKSNALKCSANVRTISIHWRFGNEHQLGWIAVALTLGTGSIGILLLIAANTKFSRVERATNIGGLNQATAFILGLDSLISDVPNDQLKDTTLKIHSRNGHVVVS